ncbi:hypothetical protein LN42_11130 [Marinitoga sp. 1137]|nr:hypothetical protein LN42_11130 [Marinitoga sp. 1137]
MSKNPKQIYLDFVYSECMKSHSSFAYILSLFARLESILSHTKLRFINSVSLDANLINLFFIASAFLAHSMKRDDLIFSIKQTKSSFVQS